MDEVLDLYTRCLRLDIPLHTAPANVVEARVDVETVLAWSPVASLDSLLES